MRPSEKFWFWREIVFTNLSRELRYALILLVINTALLVVDVVRIAGGQTAAIAGYHQLFIAHTGLFVILAVFLILVFVFRPSSADSVRRGHGALVIGIAVSLLLFSTAVTIIDQNVNGQITIYVVGCMTLSVAIYLPPRVSVPLYVLNHAGFIVAMTFLQRDPDTLLSHYVNGSIVVILAIVITKLMFDAQRRVYQGISVIQNQQARLERMAIEDGLTGLFNRRYADARLKEEFERSRRYNHPFSVAMADIDHFKNVNDRFSHQAGDEVLRQLAGLLRAEIRTVDVVARYGGEEFVIIFPETTQKIALAVCEKIRSTIESHNWHVIADELAVTISIGVSGSEIAEEYDGVVTAADQRLYLAKNAGRNQVVGDLGISDGGLVNESGPGQRKPS